MRQFVKNNKPYAQTSREDFAQKYLSEGCEEVSVLYNGNFLNPIWNGTAFVEGATPEEIAEKQNKILQNLKKQQYIELSETDWYYTRYIEIGKDIPLEIKQQRQEIRNKYNNLIHQIINE